MSNGVEVIVRGHKTALGGFEKTPWLPQKVSPSTPVTLPGHTVSRQFHMKDNPGKPGNGIGLLLQSIVRSSIDNDLISRTLVTTFTYKTTILKNSNTIVKSHEEVVSNVVTQRFQSTIQITPTEILASSSLFPDLLGTYLYSDTLYTTYIYYNSFSAGGLPMIITSRDTVSNIITMPAYLIPTDKPLTSTRVAQTETHYSTYTFSRTVKDKSVEKVVTTRETVKQVIVTESMTPVFAKTVMPEMTERPLLGQTRTKTYYTTYTNFVTELSAGELVVRSSTSIASNIVTSETSRKEETTLNLGYGTTTIQQTKTLTPVLLYATKIYYTTKTYFSTIRTKGDTINEPKIISRTQVVSRIVTEALNTLMDIINVNKLKSAYLSQHNTLMDITTSVVEIIPTRTIDVTEVKGTLMTDQVILPHWPKDDDQLVVELEPSRAPPEASIVKGQIMIEDQPVSLKRPSIFTRRPIISSSEEHFDEVKEGVHKIVNVLTNTKVTPVLNVLQAKPTKSYGYMDSNPIASGGMKDGPITFAEEVTLPEEDFTIFPDRLGTTTEDEVLTVAHLPTPPLRSSTERSDTTSKHPLKTKPNVNKTPIMDQNVELDSFPDIGVPLPKPPLHSVIVDYPSEIADYSDDDLSSGSDIKRKGSSPSTPTDKISPTKEILNLISEMTSDDEPNKDNSEEDLQPPKIYNIASTFDTEGYNQQQFELNELNKTLEAIKFKNGGVMPTFTVMNTTKGDDNSTEADVEDQMEKVQLEDPETVEANVTVIEKQEDIEETTIMPEESTSANSTEAVSSDEEEKATEAPILLEDNDALPDDNETVTESPIDLEEPEVTKVHLTFDDLLDSEEEYPTTQKAKVKYTTSKRPKKKTHRPATSYSPLSEEDSAESSTNIYALGPIRLNSGESEGVSEDEEDQKQSNLNKDQTEEDNSSESEEAISKRPLPGYSGPSKSGISFPIAAAGAGTSAIAAAATNAFNWKPLLNLGAIGLGGLGVSKLGPLFNSVAGYMKGAILPISRNDTNNNNNNNNNRLSYKNSKKPEKGRRPYYDHFPPQETPIHQHKEPIYIPLSRPGGDEDVHHNYRFSDEGIIRRPVVSHAQEPNFRPFAHGREPDFVAGPLPPPIHHEFHLEIPTPDPHFPPTHNYNFQPPNDQHPNIFTQTQPNDEVSLHKHGDPSPGPFPESSNENGNVGPEGKTEFITRPLQNLINGKPMFDNNKGQGQGRPGYITPVLRPVENNVKNNKPQPNTIRPIYKPRPGPASIEMINEIKDSQRQPYDDPSNTPQIFLPQRKPQQQHNNRPQTYLQGPLRINLPGLNLHPSSEGLPWGPSPPEYEQRFHENPFREGNLNPPKMSQFENHAQAASIESIEPNLNHGTQSPVFEHPGFISHERFNQIVTTPKSFDNRQRFTPSEQKNPPKFNNNLPNKQFDPTFQLHQNFMRRPTVQPPQPPPPRQTNRPVFELPHQTQRPHFDDSEELASQHASHEQNFKDILRIPEHSREKASPEHTKPITGSREKPTMILGPFRPISDSREKPYFPQRYPQRPPVRFKPIQESEETPQRHPEGPPVQFRPMLESEETPPPPQRYPERPQNRPSFNIPQRKPTPWTPQIYENPIHNTISPSSNDDSDELMNHRRPQLPPWPNNGVGPGQVPGRFPSPMNILDNHDRTQEEQSTHRSSEAGQNTNSLPDIPPIRRPPIHPPLSTVYIVEEEMHEDDDFGNTDEEPQSQHRQPPLGDISNHNYNATVPSPTTRPPLIVKELVTTPRISTFRWSTTRSTSPPTTTTQNYTTTTNRGLISRLFIRRFTSTTPAPGKSTSTKLINKIVLPSWATKTRPTTVTSPSTTAATTTTTIGTTTKNTSLLNDLLNFQERFKQKYGPKKPMLNLNIAASTQTHTVDKGLDDEEGLDDYASGEDSDDLPIPTSTKSNVSISTHHPNHHPIYKKPIDATKYLKDVDSDEFGQLYQGTEDKDVVVDPITRKVIKNPLITRRNSTSQFMHRSSTTTTEQDDDITTTDHSFTLTESEEDEILKKFTVPKDMKDMIFASTPPGNSKLWWPTTFRPTDEVITQGKEREFDRPTTYRPSENFLINDFLPAASSGINISHRPPLSPHIVRIAPQGGMASFYDDPDTMGQIKTKYIEINKVPTITFKQRPGTGIALVSPEDLQEYEKNVSGESSVRDKLNKVDDKMKEYPEFPETEADDSSYEGEFSVEDQKPLKLQPPKPTEPQKSYRPTAIQTLNNLIKPTQSTQNTKIQILQQKPTASVQVNKQIAVSNEISNVTGNGHRESSYIYEEEYYEEDEDSDGENRIPSSEGTNKPPENKISGPGKIIFSPKANKPTPQFINVGGHMVNGNFNKQQQQQQRPQFSTVVPHRPPEGVRIFQNQNNPLFSTQNVPKTEMEPPPIDSNRLKSPILELPSSGPIRYRPNGQEQNSPPPARPNLLRPDDELFKSSEKSQPPATHIIASVDDFNKIVGTNTFTAILPTKSGQVEEYLEPSQVNNGFSSIPASLEGSEVNVIIPSHSQGANMRLSSVIKYTGGRLHTSALIENSDINSLEEDEEDEEEDEYEEEIQPSRSSAVPPIIQRTRGPSTNVSTTSTSTTTTTTTTETSPSSSTQNIRSQILNRRPPIQIIKSVTSSGSTPASTKPTTGKPMVRRPFIPTRGPGPNIVPWARRPQASSTLRPQQASNEVQTTNNSTSVLKFSPRPFQKRPTSTMISTSVSTSSSSSDSHENHAPKERTQGTKTTFPPYKRRPGFPRGSSSSSSSSEEEINKGTTLISRFVPTQRTTSTTTTSPTTTATTTRRTTVFQNLTTSAIPSSPGSEEYEEEYSYEDEVTDSPTTIEGQVTKRPDVGVNQTVTVVTNVSNISPTRTNTGWRGGQRPKTNNSRASLESDVEMTTRYVTRTESVTTTVTETEILALTNRGVVQTQTILITKTIPPETIVSKIVGTVTLVNTLEIQPTVVRTTLFSEPTRIVPSNSFVDTSSTERVSLSGLITKGNLRPPANKLPKPEPAPSESGGNIIKRPFSVDSGCPVNCTLNSNQNLACRTYANRTRSRCDCKPGYARMKPKYPCRPTFTYEMRLGINHMNGMQFDFKDLYNSGSEGYFNFVTVAKEAIDKAFLATDIKRQFQGSEILQLNPLKENVSEPKVDVDFLVQLTTNITEDRIKNHLIRTLRTSNFSIGRTGISSTRDLNDFLAQDFNECQNKDYHDCSINAECMNNRGSYSCKCKPGFKDKSSKRKPGRECQETSGCSECNFRGTCQRDAKSGNKICQCFKWYGGVNCQINLKFMLIAVVGIGSVMFILVLLCGTLLCRKKVARPDRPGSGHFLRYRSPNSHTTMERAAIMNDSASSDGHQSPHPHPPITHSFTPDSLLVDVEPKISGVPLGHSSRNHSSSDVNLINFSLRNVIMDNERSSMAVVIPRAKIKTPSRPGSRHAAGTEPDVVAQERKLMNYLDQSPYSHASKSSANLAQLKAEHLRKFSLQEQRKISQGALVSSGEAVSAIGGMRRRSTTALDPMHPAYSASVSEVRSYDETIRCPAKPSAYASDTSRASCYSCKPPSYCAYSESHGHTMGDKDGASTVYTTQGKLFRMAHHHDDESSTASSQ